MWTRTADMFQEGNTGNRATVTANSIWIGVNAIVCITGNGVNFETNVWRIRIAVRKVNASISKRRRRRKGIAIVRWDGSELDALEVSLRKFSSLNIRVCSHFENII